MELNEFLEELRKIKGGWTINSAMAIRRVVEYPYMVQVFCPLTAVYYHKTGIYQDTICARDAAIAMGMSEALCRRIMETADRASYTGCSTKHIQMRQALEEACGLAGDGGSETRSD
jgi:hypothetical protein